MKLYQIVAILGVLLPNFCLGGEWAYNIEGHARGLYGYTDVKKHNHGVGDVNINTSAEYLLNNKNIFGLCYIQLYDVEQERNGLMTYDRKFKFDPEIFRKINTQKAAIEED